MNAWRFNNHIQDALRVSGDIVAFNSSDDKVIDTMLKVGQSKSKHLFLDTLNGIHELCFAFFDTKKKPVTHLSEIWQYMSYGSTLFFSQYEERGMCGNNGAIKAFIKEHEDEITIARQMLLNGVKEKNLIIKCFPRGKKAQFPVSNDEITVATVFKTGSPDYTVSYVNHIANSVAENVTVPYKFVCLTDCFEGYSKNVHKIVPFRHNFPKWWGKMELFAPQVFDTDRIFYLDLDTVIVDNIDELLTYNGNLFGLRDFYHQYGLATGLMGWRNNNAKIFQLYDSFMENPTANMNNYKYGDQEFVAKMLKEEYDYAQDLFPRQILSYKKDCVDNYNRVRIPEKAKIICFHGPPRPHQIKTPDINRYWRG